MNYSLLDIKTVNTSDINKGSLSIIEGESFLPFPIKRCYYIHDVKRGEMRGFHAHKTLSQLLFCPFGSISIFLDDGMEKECITLNSPTMALLVFPGLWRSMRWEQDGSVLCVLASEHYDESDYIRNYDDYISFVHNSKKTNS